MKKVDQKIHNLNINGTLIEGSQMQIKDFPSHIIQLGINAIPGTVFYINGKEIKIGLSGQYQLSKDDGIIINELYLDTEKTVDDSNIIVDYIYEDNEIFDDSSNSINPNRPEEGGGSDDEFLWWS